MGTNFNIKMSGTVRQKKRGVLAFYIFILKQKDQKFKKTKALKDTYKTYSKVNFLENYSNIRKYFSARDKLYQSV